MAYTLKPEQCGDPHFFVNDPPQPNDRCVRCGIVYCPVSYDHDEDECAVCGWESEGGAI